MVLNMSHIKWGDIPYSVPQPHYWGQVPLSPDFRAYGSVVCAL